MFIEQSGRIYRGLFLTILLNGSIHSGWHNPKWMPANSVQWAPEKCGPRLYLSQCLTQSVVRIWDAGGREVVCYYLALTCAKHSVKSFASILPLHHNYLWGPQGPLFREELSSMPVGFCAWEFKFKVGSSPHTCWEPHDQDPRVVLWGPAWKLQLEMIFIYLSSYFFFGRK